MKKIFNFMLVAMVMLVAACNNTEEFDNIKGESESLSFYAEIANDTRAYIEDENGDKTWSTVWENGDILEVSVVGTEVYNFTYDGEKFTCTETGVNSLKGQTVTIISPSTARNSYAGKQGWAINGTQVENFANSTDPISFEAHTSYFRYTYNGTEDITFSVVLTGKETGVFQDGNLNFYKEITISDKTGENFIAFWTQHNGEVEATLSCSIGGVKIKETTLNLTSGKVYNLGTIEPEVCDFTIVGGHQGWAKENGDAMYKIAGSNTYMRANVTLNNEGFKFFNVTSEKITIEHPAVTSGEEGDWYLQPNTNWKEAGARFAIYYFGDGETWVSMKDENGDGIYVANNPTTGKNYTHMIFCRMNPSATANNWNNKWNQTADLAIPTDGNNCYAVKEGTWDSGGGTWSVHVPEITDAWTEEVEKETEYWFGMGENFDITNWVDGWTDNFGGDNITVADTSKTYDIYFYHEDMQDWGGFGFSYVVLEHGSEAPELK